MKHKYIFLIAFLLLCSSAVKAQKSNIERLAEVVDSLHSNIVYPYNIAQGLVITNVGVDKTEKMLVVNYLLNSNLVETFAKNIASENGIAQILTGYDEIFSKSMIDAEAGFKIIITSPAADGSNTSKIVTIPADSIPIVYNKLKNGDSSPLLPYLEMLRTSISNMQLPMKIANGISLVNAFINDKDANWIYQFENDFNLSNLSETELRNNRLKMINNLRSSIDPHYIIEMEEQGITLHYTYLDKNGDKLYEVIISSEDLK